MGVAGIPKKDLKKSRLSEGWKMCPYITTTRREKWCLYSEMSKPWSLSQGNTSSSRTTMPTVIQTITSGKKNECTRWFWIWIAKKSNLINFHWSLSCTHRIRQFLSCPPLNYCMGAVERRSISWAGITEMAMKHLFFFAFLTFFKAINTSFHCLWFTEREQSPFM